MNLQSKNNAKEAFTNFKMEIANELGYDYNPETDKVQSNVPQGTLDAAAQNVLAGEDFGGTMTKNLVKKGIEILMAQNNSNKLS